MTAMTMKSIALARPGGAHLHPLSRNSPRVPISQPGGCGQAEQGERRPPDGDAQLGGRPSARRRWRRWRCRTGCATAPSRPARSAPATRAGTPGSGPRRAAAVEPKTACGGLPAGGAVQSRHPRGAVERLDAGQRRALQHQEGRQRHQEARQPRVHHQEAVDQRPPAGRRRATPSAPARCPSRPRSISRAVTSELATRDHPDGEVELARDEQQGDRDPADAQERARVEDAGQAADGEQARRLEPEHRDDHHEADQGRQARPGQRPVDQPPAARERRRPARPAWAGGR